MQGKGVYDQMVLVAYFFIFVRFGLLNLKMTSFKPVMKIQVDQAEINGEAMLEVAWSAGVIAFKTYNSKVWPSYGCAEDKVS